MRTVGEEVDFVRKWTYFHTGETLSVYELLAYFLALPMVLTFFIGVVVGRRVWHEYRKMRHVVRLHNRRVRAFTND